MIRRPILLAAVAMLAAACAESTATIDETDAWETKSADPEFIRRAETALAEAEPPTDGWHVGIILAEQGERLSWEASVLTDTGPVVVATCRSGSGGYEGFGLITDPGDLITWSPAGDDHLVCDDELHVIRKAAA